MYEPVQTRRACVPGLVLLAVLAPGAEVPQARLPGEVFAEAQSLRMRGGPVNLRQAAQKYQEAQALYRAAHDDRGLANASYWAGRAYDALSDKRNGLASFDQALPLFRALGDPSGEAQTLIYMALDYVYLGQAAKARTSG